MYDVTSGQLPRSENNMFCAFYRPAVHTQHLIDDLKEGIKSGLDCVATINRHITMQDLLQHSCIGHQSLSVGNKPFEQPLRISLVRVRRANQIYRDVRVIKNHGRRMAVCPASISASIRSILLRGY
jgi:hypothetical protein